MSKIYSEVNGSGGTSSTLRLFALKYTWKIKLFTPGHSFSNLEIVLS
jgi:hypothetical protein